jgi:hypothetical protein
MITHPLEMNAATPRFRKAAYAVLRVTHSCFRAELPLPPPLEADESNPPVPCPLLIFDPAIVTSSLEREGVVVEEGFGRASLWTFPGRRGLLLTVEDDGGGGDAWRGLF